MYFQIDRKMLQIVRRLFCCFILVCMLCGCVSTQMATSSKDETKVLSSKFGVQLSQKKDNIALYSECASWIGTPYKTGGTSRSGVDCSGFVQSVYKKVYNKKLSRESIEMLRVDCNKIMKSRLREGDLVFFHTGKKRKPNHVGIYLKDGKFVHASSSRGVMVSDLSETYFLDTWHTAGRVK